MNNTQLYDMAVSAAKNAYAPYSRFKVGSALLCEDGKVFTGCNVENVSFSATLCAERNAISTAVNNGYTTFIKLAVATVDGKRILPCGICRQVITEFAPHCEIIFNNDGEIASYYISDPLADNFGGFSPSNC